MNTRGARTEDDLIGAASSYLAKHGQVARQFITATLGLAVSSRRPDLVFIPNEEPQRTYIVEVKTDLREPADAVVASSVRNLRAIRGANPTINLYFALALRETPSNEVATLAGQNGLRLLAPIQSGEELGRAMVAWTRDAHIEASLRVLHSEVDEIRASSRDVAIGMSEASYMKLMKMESETDLDVIVKAAPPAGLLPEAFRHLEVMGELFSDPKVVRGGPTVQSGDSIRLRVRRE